MNSEVRAIVVNIDQRSSRGSIGGIEALERALAGSAAELHLLRPFVRLWGDEMQGLLCEGEGLLALIDIVHDTGDYWISIGAGRIDELRGSTNESGGTLFDQARDVMDVVKKRRQRGRRHLDKFDIDATWPIGVVSDRDDAAKVLEYMLGAYWRLLSDQTEQQRLVGRLTSQGLDRATVAARIGTPSPRNISRALRDGRWHEAMALRRAAIWMTDSILQERV